MPSVYRYKVDLLILIFNIDCKTPHIDFILTEFLIVSHFRQSKLNHLHNQKISGHWYQCLAVTLIKLTLIHWKLIYGINSPCFNTELTLNQPVINLFTLTNEKSI